MQSITRRGHLALAGLFGGLIGVLVVAIMASPVAAPATANLRPASSEAPVGYNARQVQPGDWDMAPLPASARAFFEHATALNARQILPGDTDSQAASSFYGTGNVFEALEIRLL